MLILRNPTVALLFVGQALYWSCSILGITLTSLVGLRLAPWPALATLPLALLVLGALAAVQPLSLFMQRRGRRPGLVAGALAGVAGGLVCAAAIALGQFALFGAGAFLIGVYQASASYYRFAALEAVPTESRGRAAAYVVGGGLLAALLAPPLALGSRDALAEPFAGAYVAIAVLAALGALLMACLREGPLPPAPTRRGWAAMRALAARPRLRAALAVSAAGHGLMVLVMNATPLAMSACGLSLASSAEVIRWHVVGMFLPAFFAGRCIERWGSPRVAVTGAVALAASAAVALAGQSEPLFLVSSFLLGIGWNLMLIAGTTLLADTHAPEERGHAQALMELVNGSAAALMSFGSGLLTATLGWSALNAAMLPVLAAALLALRAARPGRLPAQA